MGGDLRPEDSWSDCDRPGEDPGPARRRLASPRSGPAARSGTGVRSGRAGRAYARRSPPGPRLRARRRHRIRAAQRRAPRRSAPRARERGQGGGPGRARSGDRRRRGPRPRRGPPRPPRSARGPAPSARERRHAHRPGRPGPGAYLELDAAPLRGGLHDGADGARPRRLRELGPPAVRPHASARAAVGRDGRARGAHERRARAGPGPPSDGGGKPRGRGGGAGPRGPAGARVSVRAAAPPPGGTRAAGRAPGGALGGRDSMSCPACGTAMSAGLERCPGCGATVAPAVEGALARDPARSRTEPLREIPGLKKKERTWKDEVRERVRDRKRARGQELPLFRDTAEEEEPDAADPSLGGPTLLVAPPLEEDPPPQTRSGGPAAAAASARMELGDDADLPLRPAAAAAVVPAAELRLAEIEPEPVRVAPRVPEHSADDEWTLGGETAEQPRPVERPAHSGQRARPAAVDLALPAPLWALVLHFASRAAHVGLLGLRPP